MGEEKRQVSRFLAGRCFPVLTAFPGSAPETPLVSISVRRRFLVLTSLLAALLMSGLLSGCTGKAPRQEAAEVTEASVGQTIPIAGTEMTFEIREAYQAEEVKPENPGGYFYYYEDVEGWHYQVVSGILHNPEQEMLSPDRFAAEGVKGKTVYETKAVLENSTASTFMGEGEETVAEAPGLYLIALVEDGKDGPQEMTLYYNEGLAEKDGDGPWDQGIRIFGINPDR